VPEEKGKSRREKRSRGKIHGSHTNVKKGGAKRSMETGDRTSQFETSKKRGGGDSPATKGEGKKDFCKKQATRGSPDWKENSTRQQQFWSKGGQKGEFKKIPFREKPLIKNISTFSKDSAKIRLNSGRIK